MRGVVNLYFCKRHGVFMYDKNKSPTGWYIGSYVLRFVELDWEGNDDPERRFNAWENTILVKAENLEDAYDKIVEVASMQTVPYKGGHEGVPVQWVFEGVTELLPVYEEFAHGSELMYREYGPTKLKNLRKQVRSKDEFRQ